MTEFVPVDHDPFAAAPAPASSSAGPQFIPVDHDPFAASPAAPSPSDMVDTGGAPPLTIRVGRKVAAAPSPPPPIQGSAPVLPPTFVPANPAPASSPPAPGGMSYEDAVASMTPNPGGVLSNAPDDDTASGLAKGAGTAVIRGLSHVPGMMGDAMSMAQYLGARAQAVIQGRPVDEVLKELADQKAAAAANPSWTRYLQDPGSLYATSQDVAAPVLKQTGEYVPQTEAGKLGMAAGETAVAGLAMGGDGVVPALSTGGVRAALPAAARALVPNAVAGAASQGAQDLTGDPLYGLGAGLLAPMVAGGAGHMLGAAALPIAAGTPGLRDTALVRNAVDTAAARKLVSSFSTPQAAQDFASQPVAQSDIPNSPNTLAATVGNDPKLFRSEMAARSVDNTDFNAVDAAKSRAQVAALGSAQPTGDTLSPGQLLSSRMDAVDAAAQAVEDRLNAAHQEATANTTGAGQAFASAQNADLAARTVDRTQAAADARSQGAAQRQASEDSLVQAFQDTQGRQIGAAQDAAAPLGPNVPSDSLGGVLRPAIEEVRQGAKELHRGLYDAVDPNGTAVFPSRPAAQGATGIVDGVRADGSTLTPAEAPLFARAQALGDYAPYRVLHALDKDIGAAVAQERRSAGETPAWARLTQLKGAVRGAIMNAVDNHAAMEREAVGLGVLHPEDTIEARLGSLYDDGLAVGSDASAALGRTGTFDGEGAGGGASVSSRAGRTGLQGNGQSGRAAGRSGIPPEAPVYGNPHDDPDLIARPQPPGVPRPRDLHQFIRDSGGMQDPGGDLKAMGFDRVRGFIAKPGKGLSPDRMREAAAEQGYLGAHTDDAMAGTGVNDLLDAVASDRPTYSVHDQEAAHAWDAYDANREHYEQVRRLPSRPAGEQRAAPVSAYSQEDAYPGGMAPADRRAGEPVPNADPAAANRLKAANAAYADYARTYKNPIVGPGLKTTGYASQYQRSNSAFIKGAIKPGPDGYEAAKAHLTAAKGDPAAIGAMQEAALNGLRKTVTGNGTIPQAGLARWKSPDGYGPALRALDEATPGFSSRFDQAGQAEQALTNLGAQHQDALDAHQAQALAAALKEKLGLAADLKSANAADRATTARAIADRQASDRAAVAASKDSTAAGIATARGMVRQAKASPAGQFVRAAGNAIAPVEVENTMGGFLQTGKTGVARMRGLVSSLANDPDALAGLRKAGTGWMAREFVDNGTGLLNGTRFIGFVRDNMDTLKELYPHDTVSMMGALARDAEVGAKWRTETADKKGSDSIQKWIATGAGNNTVHNVSLGMMAVEAIHQGFEHGGLSGAAYGGGAAALAYLVNSLRSSGVDSVGKLYRQALADPELARTLISKMPAGSDSCKLHDLARVLKRSLIVGPMLQRQLPAPDPAPSYTPPVESKISVPADHPILKTARRAPDGFYYVQDPRAQGRFMRVGQ